MQTVSDPTTVVVVDDHELVRRGVRHLLRRDQGIRVVGESATASDAIQLLEQLQPDVAILDVRLGQGSGTDVARAAKDIAPTTKILILSAYDDDCYVRSLARLGVSGYLLKTASAKELGSAVQDIAKGGLVFPPGIAQSVTRLLQENVVSTFTIMPSRRLARSE